MHLSENPSRIRLERILLLADYPPWADVAVPYALGLARGHRAQMHVAHPVPTHAFQKLTQVPQGGPFRQRWRDLVFEAAERQVVTDIESIGPRLRQIAGRHDFDLVVLSTTQSIDTKALRSALEHIVESTTCPVMIVGPGVRDSDLPKAEPATILHATDFSPHALAAAQHAFAWAQEYQSWVTMLHVIEGVSPWIEHECARLEQPFRQWMEELVPPELPLWCEVEHRVAFGNAADAIVHTAEERHADLLVIGMAGMDGATQSVPGTTAYEVISRARCPVLLVRDYMKKMAAEPVIQDRRSWAAVAA